MNNGVVALLTTVGNPMAEQEMVTGLWQSLVAKLQSDNRLTPQILGFISLVEPKGVLGETLYLEVPNELTREVLQNRIRSNILEAMENNAEFGGPVNFAVVVNPDIESSFSSSSSDALGSSENAYEDQLAEAISFSSQQANPQAMQSTNQVNFSPLASHIWLWQRGV
jgi:chromosomal replication initiation ATPase DnaA